MIEARTRQLNVNKNSVGRSVIYVMSRDQRVDNNFALLAAQQKAKELNLPLAVVFCLYPNSGRRAREHYEFMLNGLSKVEQKLNKLSIPLIVIIGEAREKLLATFNHYQPVAVYFDFSPLNGPQKLHQKIAAVVDFACYEVDTHNIVPAWVTSNKQEFAARTIRPKINRLLADYLKPVARVTKQNIDWPGQYQRLSDLMPLIDQQLALIPSNGVRLMYLSGEAAARIKLVEFLSKLGDYAERRSDPTYDALSGLSPYLHFGQLSPLEVALCVYEAAERSPAFRISADDFLEELIVRRELADNFCFYNSNYANLAGAPQWAQLSLAEHVADRREFVYDFDTLARGETHDPAWNAAQHQLTAEGKMHGYMRMYWAKKVLEWTELPAVAVEYLVKLNDFYSIDGGDPNGYAGILWSVAGLHDRPWFERPIYGKIRYMNYNGLKRKFNIAKYIENHG